MRWSEIIENASSGATGSASVATVVGGLGAGFDSEGNYGIYPKPKRKPLVIRRNITEMFDKSSKITWVEQTNKRWRAKFVVDGKTFELKIAKMFDLWRITFWQVGIVQGREWAGDVEIMDAITNSLGKNAIEVFSTVLLCIKQFAEQVRPNLFVFKGYGKKGELYKKISTNQLFFKKLGYSVKVQTDDDWIKFQFRLNSSD